MSAADQTVVVFEVGPRDGLQNERRLISVADKISLIEQLARCGLRKIESASFVSPKWVPQMADAAQVMGGIRRRDSVAAAWHFINADHAGKDRTEAAMAMIGERRMTSFPMTRRAIMP